MLSIIAAVCAAEGFWNQGGDDAPEDIVETTTCGFWMDNALKHQQGQSNEINQETARTGLGAGGSD